jgi:phosphoglycolate phosphatase
VSKARIAGPIDAAIIDLDGTMVDTLGDFVQALGGSFAELGLAAPDASFIAATIGKGSRHLIMRSLAAAGVGDPAALYERTWQHYQQHYARVNGRHSTVFAGVPEGLTALRARGLRLACLTNKPLAFARELLEAKSLAPHFSCVFGGDSFERQKPDPLPLIETCRALGAAPSRTLMVGDSSNDALAARAAGCPVVLVDYGYNHGQPVAEAGADAVIGSLAELVAWLPPMTGD